MDNSSFAARRIPGLFRCWAAVPDIWRKRLTRGAALLSSVAALDVCPGQAPADFTWVTHLKGSGPHDSARWVATDQHGNIYVTGQFGNLNGQSSTLSVGSESITSQGKLDVFLAKLDPDGRVLWLRRAGGEGVSRGYRVAVDRQGNCYVSGSHDCQDFSVGEVHLPMQGTRAAFLAKYAPDGKVLWAHSAGGVQNDHGFGVAVDHQGNCFWTGGITGAADFGGIRIAGTGSAFFLAKYNPDGGANWVRHAGGKGGNGGRGVAIDPERNVLVTGFIIGRADFGGRMLGNENERNVFAAKYDTLGKLIWAHDGGGHSDAIGQAIESDVHGNTYITGMFKGTPTFGSETLHSAGADDIFLAKYDPSGKAIWARRAGGPGIDYSLALRVLSNGEAIVAGDYAKEPEFGGIELGNNGKSDIFIAQYTAQGSVDWVRTNGGPDINVCYGLALTPDNGVIVISSFAGQTSFGHQLFTSVVGWDIVVGKLKKPDSSVSRTR